MRVQELFEKITSPHAFDLFDLLDGCIAEAKSTDQLRELLQARVQDFLDAKLGDTSGHKLIVSISPPVGRYTSGGFFRYNDAELSDEDAAVLPLLGEGVVEIRVILDDDDLENMLDKSANTIKRFANTVLHEFRHYQQFLRADGNWKPLARYTVGLKRTSVDGTKVGKRGGYRTPDQSYAAYQGMDIEIAAAAVGAASDVIADVRTKPPGERHAYLRQVLRSNMLRQSQTISTYFETFATKSLGFLFGGRSESPLARRRKARQRELVWRSFQKQVAAELIDYLDRLDADPADAGGALPQG